MGTMLSRRTGIVLYAVAPHPPIIVPEVGRDETAKVARTRAAMAEIADAIRAEDPEVLIVISPHAPVYSDAVAINMSKSLEGDFRQFGARKARIEAENDRELAEAVATYLEEAGLSAVGLDELELDHGTMVPLYFLQEKGPLPKVVSLAMSLYPRADLYRAGEAITRAVDKLARRAVLIASGDLSHRLKPGAPAGYSPRGAEFDRLFSEAIRAADARAALAIDDRLREEAGECGYRSIIMMFGAAGGRKLENLIHSYEGPFGVGYCVSLFRPRRDDAASLTDESALVRLARRTVEEFVRTGRIISPNTVPVASAEEEAVLSRRAGVFVSLHLRGELRGCIGTIEPQQENVAAEIIANAIAAATDDPRFPPVRPEELDELEISVDVLGRPEPVTSLDQLDPRRYGVIVSKGWRRGLLLPDLPGVDTVEEQVDIARRKAGIARGEEVKLERFEVVRYH